MSIRPNKRSGSSSRGRQTCGVCNTVVSATYVHQAPFWVVSSDDARLLMLKLLVPKAINLGPVDFKSHVRHTRTCTHDIHAPLSKPHVVDL